MKLGAIATVILFLATTGFTQQRERLGPGITPPWTGSKVNPLYSDTARTLGIEGTVILDAIVRKDGRVEVVGVKQGLGYGLDENATLAVRRLQLTPARKNDEPIDVAMDIAVEFSLSNDLENLRQSPNTFVRPPRCVSLTGPTVISRVEPRYPDIARNERVTGDVALDAVVKKDGSLEIIRVARSLDYGLDAAAVEAISKWKFKPGMCDGFPRETSFTIEVNFRLP
jgi:TonB family protein